MTTRGLSLAAAAVLLSSAAVARRHSSSAPAAGAGALLEASAEFPVGRMLAQMLAASGRHPAAQPGNARDILPHHDVADARRLAIAASAASRIADGDEPRRRTAAAIRAVGVAPTLAPLVASSPLLTEVKASRAETGALVMPAGWAERIEDGSVAALEGADGAKASYYVAAAKLSAGRKVRIAAGVNDAPETQRELLVSQLLSQTGAVPTFFERQVFPDATFMLTEHVGARQLEALIAERPAGPREGPAVPLPQALPLMIDLLRGLVGMEHLGIAYGDLAASKIYLLEGDRRAVITDFRQACLQDAADPRLRCSAGAEGPAAVPGAELRQAPEDVEGRAGSTASNVWQMGLVFARMLLGGDVPTEAVVLQRMSPQDMAKLAESAWKSRDGGAENDDELAWLLRAEMREIIRRHFSIREAEGFQRLLPDYADVLEILEGMLEKQRGARWTASQALAAATEAALARGVAVPAPRPQAKLPEGWAEDWQ